MKSPITRAYVKAKDLVKSRGWDKMYILLDIHATVIVPNWSDTEVPNQFYDNCIDVLKIMSEDPGIVLIMWTSSHNKECLIYEELLLKEGVKIDYTNENPEVPTMINGYGNYDKKPYMNMIIDDKAGFEPETDWKDLRDFLEASKP